MSKYDNTNRGALFENDKRQKESHPHLRGACTIKTPDGELVEYWVSAWQKTTKKGEDFFSLSFQLKEDSAGKEPDKPDKPASQGGLFKKREGVAQTASKTIHEELNDDVPF
jgi:hypothetical protein